jgi:hypothetical protein
MEAKHPFPKQKATPACDPPTSTPWAWVFPSESTDVIPVASCPYLPVYPAAART